MVIECKARGYLLLMQVLKFSVVAKLQWQQTRPMYVFSIVHLWLLSLGFTQVFGNMHQAPTSELLPLQDRALIGLF